MDRKQYDNYKQRSGPLSDYDIKQARDNADIMISNYSDSNLTPLGYNLTPTRFVFSIKKRTIEKIHTTDGVEFVWIRPNDTVLILSRESIFISQRIMGTFHSKVGMVSIGLGHIGTTLDPLWEGPLLFALNNPTSKKIKLELSKINKDTGVKEHKSFVTVIFQSLVSEATKMHDNPSARMNILKSHIKGNYFVYKDLKVFCEEINALNQAKEPLVRQVRPDLYNCKENGELLSMQKTDIKKYFEKKYCNYIQSVDDSVDKILKINKWVILFNLLKKYWLFIVLEIVSIFFVLVGLGVWGDFFGLGEDKSILLYIGFPGIIAVLSIILSIKINETN